jgi:7-cyano-7-deazaguanine synthase
MHFGLCLPRPGVTSPRPLAVLTSGGVDSAVLTADLARQGWVVQPLYIRFGLAWEVAEETYLRRFLDTLLANLRPRPLVVLDLPIADVYGAHWSVSGEDVPDGTTADSAVYLPGRNLLLLAKSTVWCALHGVQAIALGTLKGNPFADSGPEFLSLFGSLVQLGLDRPLEVMTPFAGFTKAQVLELGRDLALEHTFSCIAPVEGRHCGRCNKCAERRDGFAQAGIEDHTVYSAV